MHCNTQYVLPTTMETAEGCPFQSDNILVSAVLIWRVPESDIHTVVNRSGIVEQNDARCQLSFLSTMTFVLCSKRWVSKSKWRKLNEPGISVIPGFRHSRVGLDENRLKRCLKGVIRCAGWISELRGGVGFVLVSPGCVTTQKFVEIEDVIKRSFSCSPPPHLPEISFSV